MPCERVTIDGVTAIVCGPRRRRPRCACGQPAPFECDWKVPENKSGTCDKPICETCSTKPAEGKDLCPQHAEDWKAWLAQRAGAA